MNYNPLIHNRKSIRLKDYDYSSEGLYFVTICVNKKICLFGEIKNNELILNDSGKMIENEWKKLKDRFENIVLHNFVIMPNHFHGIIEIFDDSKGTHKGHPYRNENDNSGKNVGAIPCGCPNDRNCGCQNSNENNNSSIGNIIGSFKSITTNEYIKNIKSNKWKPFYMKLWQRNFYEHIIRDKKDLYRIKEYITNNPIKWNEDKLYINEL